MSCRNLLKTPEFPGRRTNSV